MLQGNTAFYYSKAADRGYIDSLEVTVDGEKVPLVTTDNMPDVARIDLPKPLLPGKRLQLATPFRVKIPKVFSRLGHTGQAYYISQWFPKPAVYDHKGWHPMPYLDFGEFYSEIGSYDVSITLPQNYIVMATGNCTDASENAWLDSLSRLPGKRGTDSTPVSSPVLKTIHFREDNVHDFAFFADKRWIVRKETFSIEGRSEPITAWAAYLPSDWKYWMAATDYMKAAVQYLSREVGPYPYATVKAVEGDMKAGGGMEYPTITIIDRAATRSDFKTTIIHEVGHNWFQGILATNERDHPWMDEGFNTFYQDRVPVKRSGDSTGRRDTTSAGNNAGNISINFGSANPLQSIYYQGALTGTDQPLTHSSFDYTELNYGIDVYYKTAFLVAWLEGYMGKDAYRAAMNDYYDTWKHRHPYPEDMEAVFRKHTDKPLDWFFRDAVRTDRAIDFSIRKVQVQDDRAIVTLRNRSGFPAPVRIDARAGGKEVTDSVWTAPFEGDTTIQIAAAGVRTWRVGEEVPDANARNNVYRRHKFPHTSGIRPGIGFRLDPKDRMPLNLLPAIGYNVYDGFMAGLLLHNLTLPEHNFRYVLAPMYGFGSKALVGAGSVGYFFHPGGAFQEVALQADVKSFHMNETSLNIDKPLYARYLKAAPSLTFTLKKRRPISTASRTLMLKGYHISEDAFNYVLNPVDSLYRPFRGEDVTNTYGLIRYRHQNDRTFNPFSYTAEVQGGAEFLKISLEGRLRIDYNLKGKSLHIRAFAGKFIGLGSDPRAGERYWLNTTFNGPNDYLYDDTYIGRNRRDGIGYHQISIREGGFKLPTDFYSSRIGRSDDWLVALNLKTDLPLKRIPIRVFLDLGTFAHADKQNPTGNKFLYTAGAELHLLNDLFLLHVPFVFSEDYSDYLKSIYPKNRFLRSITFSLQLQNINWLKAVGGALKFAN